ncbi:hypothetical protein [Brevibacillus sp. SYSU BS000544]|uniref:hypothetical protein n=1 Tax=Brevibacillus sp. SYSU BS000544 TaxID=3416443 RepID=UPI003CE5874A
MKDWFKKLVQNEKGISFYQILLIIASIGVVLTLVVPAVTWMQKDNSPEKQRANAIHIVESAKKFIVANGYKSENNETVTLRYFEPVDKNKVEKEISLEANSYMTISLKDLKESGIFKSVDDPKTGEDYDLEKTIVYIQEDASKQLNYWVTLASGTNAYFDKMRYEDVLDGDAKVKQ